METLTFDQLPNAVAMLTKEVRELKRLLIEKQEQAPTEQPEQLLTIQEAAEFLSLAVPTIYSKVSKGQIPVMKQGKRLYFSRTELLEYIKKGRRKTNVEIEQEAKAYLLNNNLELAKNPNTPIETLDELAKDRDWRVRNYVASNPNTTAETLAELAKDEDWFVRRYAAINPNTPEESLSELAKDEDSEVRSYAAKNPRTPAETLVELAKDEDIYVRRYAAGNPKTPAETLAELAEDEDWRVRRNAARNPQYAKKTIKRKNI